MVESDIEIRLLGSAQEMAAAGMVFQQVWGSSLPLVAVELLQAIAHSGGYVIGAYEHGSMVGASFGFLGRHDGELALHSHVTGILPGVQRTGIGRAIKEHQRAWAQQHDIAHIVWTFDPLVRRNAWFNIEVLGAHIGSYLENFYGEMSDSINAHDDTDRLLVAWPSDPNAPRPEAAEGTEIIEVETPEDIVKLRRTDQTAAAEWRSSVRAELGGALARGGVVVGFTREGNYRVAVPA